MPRTDTDTAATPASIAHNVADFVTGIKDQAMDMKKEYVDDTWAATSSYVKKNPGKAILFSVAAGLVLGSLIRRR